MMCNYELVLYYFTRIVHMYLFFSCRVLRVPTYAHHSVLAAIERSIILISWGIKWFESTLTWRMCKYLFMRIQITRIFVPLTRVFRCWTTYVYTCVLLWRTYVNKERLKRSMVKYLVKFVVFLNTLHGE